MQRNMDLTDMDIKLNYEVYKKHGYKFVGVVRSIFTTSNGIRVAVEHKDGWIFIFKPDDLAIVYKEG